jgi:UDP-N-acetylglucosamine:LPS N-acetylglucosamine transferase
MNHDDDRRRERVLLVSSSGGHLQQLHRLAPWWSKHERMWVTFDTADATSMLAGEEIAWAYRPTTRNLRNLARNTLLACRVLARFRPTVVVSTGAGAAFPFFVLARALGIRTVYVEVYDRIDLPTLTGRLCYPLSSLFLVQWADQRRFYPRSQLIGRLL